MHFLDLALTAVLLSKRNQLKFTKIIIPSTCIFLCLLEKVSISFSDLKMPLVNLKCDVLDYFLYHSMISIGKTFMLDKRFFFF